MMLFDLALVLFVVGFFGPILIMLIESLRNEKRIHELELMLWSLLPDEPRKILESDLPKEEVKKWV